MKNAVQTVVEFRQIDLWSLFKIAFLLYATLGLIAGLFFGFVVTVLGGLGSFLNRDELPGIGIFSPVLGVLAVPMMAVMYGVAGSIAVTIGAGLYNVAAHFLGGVRMHLNIGMPPEPATPPPPGAGSPPPAA